MTHQVLYDDACNFCKVIVDGFMDWDRGRLRAVAIQSDEGQALLRDMPVAKRLESFHLVRPDGTVASAGRALEELFALVPGGSPLAAVLHRFPAGSEAGYAWIARNRMTLSRPVPAALKRRATRRLAARRAAGR